MPDAGHSDSAPGIRQERDRFVAFAFAAADLLLEVDAEGRIGYAAGALKSLTHHDAASLTGRAFTELLCDSDRALAKVLLASLKDGGRLSPMLVKLAPPTSLNVVLGGCRPPEYQSHQITMTVLPARLAVEERPGPRDPATGLLAKDEFARVAEEKLRQPGPFRLSLVEVGGLERLREDVDQELAAGFVAAVGRHLRQPSAERDTPGRRRGGEGGGCPRRGRGARAIAPQHRDAARAPPTAR